jgi:oxygen-independent coproporphyrinogen III oxidase
VPASHLYVHVPFCARRCAYCDFSIAVRRSTPVAEYVESLRRELAGRELDSHAVTDSLKTLYLGGGTPSRLGAEGISEVISTVRERFDLEDDAEITIEVNPDDVTTEGAAGWKNAGANRISLGIQSFDDSVLEWMHRVHDSATAVRSFDILRSAGFDNISVDLIFALPESVKRSWQSDLETAIRLAPDHISLYGLTIEPATPLARWAERGMLTPSDEDRYAEEFLLADSMTRAAGFEHYEVSNFSLPGKRSRHNSAYWSGVEYIGVGPSAHSFDGESRSWNVKAYADWTARLMRGESVIEGSEILTAENRVAERVYLGLRTRDGLPMSSSNRAPLDQWADSGWATVDGDVLRLTSEGWLRLDSLAAALTEI